MYVLFVILSICVASARSSVDEINEDEGVLVLTDKNFQGAIAAYQYILVEFYTPWCKHCQALKPEYEKAAKKLREEGSAIRLAKVDASTERQLVEQFEVQGFPTIKFFVNSTASAYSGGRQAYDIVNWLKKKTGPTVALVDSLIEVQDFLNAHELAIFGVFQNDIDSASRAAFDSNAQTSDLPFALTIDADKEILAALGLEENANAILLVKQPKVDPDAEAEHLRSRFTESNWTKDAIEKWISEASMPTVIDFSSQTAPKIFQGSVKRHTVLIDSKSREGHEKLRKEFGLAARKFRGRSLFISIDSDVEEHERVIEFFSVKPRDVPKLRTVLLGDVMTKFRFPDEDLALGAPAIERFVEDVISKRMKPYLLSQDLPADWDKHPVKVVVTSTYSEIVNDKSKHRFIEIYAPWCGHCQALAAAWEQLGELFKHRDDILIAKMDGTKNEIEELQVGSFPALKWYPKGSDKEINYEGDRSIDALKRFVETDGKEVMHTYSGEPDAEVEGQDEKGRQIPKEPESSSSAKKDKKEL